MKRTLHYLLPYREGGDLYRASEDLEGMVVTDNQLEALARIIGDGVLSGWTVCHTGPLEVEVSPGVGFINGIVHKTLSKKTATVVADVQTTVYMQSTMIPSSGGLNIETEGPASNLVSVVYVDITPPAVPTGLTAVAADFDLINLFWNANSETDFHHYELQRSTSPVFSTVDFTATPQTNGVAPSFPLQDTGLTESTTYYYRIRAYDASGNISAFSSTVSETTLPNGNPPAEPSGFRLFSGDSVISAVWNASATPSIKYRIFAQALNPDDSPNGSPIVADDVITLYWQFTGLTNGLRYRVTLQSKRGTGLSSVYSNGVVIDGEPESSAAPLDALLVDPLSVTPMADAALVVTSLANSIGLSWVASPSPTGSGIGQKKEYRIRVIKDGVESAPIRNIGTALSKTVFSYNETAAVGEGKTVTLKDDISYVFRITTLDTVGNESAGLYAVGTTVDLTPPADLRFLRLVAGDERITAFWAHSSTADVVGYVANISINAGPFGADIPITYVEKALFLGSTYGFTNGDDVTIRIRAKDDATPTANLSAGVFATATPEADTVAPAIPTFFRGTAEDSQNRISWRANSEDDISHYILNRVSILETLPLVSTLNLTEITELPKNIISGSITSNPSVASFVSSDVLGFPNLVDYVVVMTSGAALDERATIASLNGGTGQIIFSAPLTTAPSVGDTFVIRRTHDSLGTLLRNVGTATNILDIGLLNGQVYAYYVKAVDLRGNESPFSAPLLTCPTCGLNDLPPPLNLVATAGVGTVTLTWDQLVPDADHPATVPPSSFDHTAFNIYRSTTQFAGFELIDSIAPDVLGYVDSNLLNAQTYYYIVTAVRDNAEVLVDSGAVQPSQTVALASVKINLLTPLGCEITAIENQQRLLERLSATISEETERRLFEHKHTVKPLNTTAVEAVPLLATVDATLLPDLELDDALSAEGRAYLRNVQFNPDGTQIVYDSGSTYAISPSSIVGNVPYVGDFQVLVNGEIPTAEFRIDENLNTIIFPVLLNETDVVSLSGGGFSYYVPAKIDLGYRGFEVLVNDEPAEPTVDEQLQTLRFLQPLVDTDIVSVVIEPVVPDFGTQQGARQVSLSPNIVLSDFSTVNQTLFTSDSGAFEVGDTYFVLVNNERTTLIHTVDPVAKTIVFNEVLEPEDTVALEILNREEVQGLLPVSRIGDIDGSQFKSGKVLKAQLPPLSHTGRVNELALPIFQTLTTDNKYVYQAGEGLLGSATTPYAIHQFEDGKILLGTSGGLLKTTGFAAFLGEGEETDVTIDHGSKPPGGLKFESATPDDIVIKTADAAKFSGRFNGNVTLSILSGPDLQPIRQVQSPNMVLLDNGKVLISGGALFSEAQAFWYETDESYLYDPTTQAVTAVQALNQKRRDHCSVLLPDGRVLISGGSEVDVYHIDPILFSPDGFGWGRLSSCEIFDPAFNTWTPTGDMVVPRDFHTLTLISDNEVLAAGGQTGFDDYNGQFRPPHTENPEPTQTSEIFNVGLGTWTASANMNRTRIGAESKFDGGVAIVTGGGQEGREIFSTDPSALWTFEGSQSEIQQDTFRDEFGINSIDSPVKQFFVDSSGVLFVVSRNNVFASDDDGETFVKTKGLEAVAVVHRVAEDSDNTLYAATDLGVYEMTASIKEDLTWFQGGLIGAGTTETFDLQDYGTEMLAATELGLFSSSDDGDTWTQRPLAAEDVFNIEKIDTILFANAGRDLHRSDDGGLTWTKVATLNFIDPNAKMVARTPLDLFFATQSGLYATRDGVNFFLVDFDRNRHVSENNVHMADVIGSDLIVGYDNALFTIGPEFSINLVAEFVGVVPTVLVNDREVRNGFRYDTALSQVVFEVKRLVNDVIKVTSNYGIYEPLNGQWYSKNPNAPVIVYVNKKVQDDSGITLNSRLGQIVFAQDLKKTDSVTVSIAGTTLKNEGELFHEELEDRLEMEKGLPLSLGRDHAGNILQLGLSVEHNFLERGIERNQYYCLSTSLVDRSFNSFLANAEFYIFGRRDFDRFNSTIDYKIESEQLDIGTRSLIPLSALEVSSDLWVGTENGIFVLDPTAATPFSISKTIAIGDDNPIRDMKFFNGDVWLVTRTGIYMTDDGGITFEQNDGNGLPSLLLTFASLGNIAIVGAGDGIYYSDSSNQAPPYSIWFRAAFVEGSSVEEVFVTSPCNAITVSEGVAYAGIGDSVFVSIDGKTWSREVTFDEGTTITAIVSYAKRLFVGTNKGIYSDDGSTRSATPAFRLEQINATTTESEEFSVTDLFVRTDGTVTSLYATGNRNRIYRFVNGAWTNTEISGISAIQKFIIVAGPKQVALANDSVYVQ